MAKFVFLEKAFQEEVLLLLIGIDLIQNLDDKKQNRSYMCFVRVCEDFSSVHSISNFFPLQSNLPNVLSMRLL